MVSAISTNENNTSFWEKAAGVGAGYATYVEAKSFARRPYGKYILKQLEKNYSTVAEPPTPEDFIH